MDTQTQNSLLMLLSELITVVKKIQAEQAVQHDMLERLLAKPVEEPKPAKARKPRKGNGKAKEEQKPEPEEQPVVADEVKRDPQFAAVEQALWSSIKADYGDDEPCPVILQGEGQSFIVDGARLDSEGIQNVVLHLQKFPAATPADVAKDMGLPKAAVYLVQMMTTQPRG